ncbi:hypothetical protein E8A74_14475 [Polyangium fumosum]|uniref:Uncharacterized protein n=1 Tax=Polyangium fumosum TaxID=889272 RepID=A0A4U1JDR6_9BACT|nr:hypothetical protein E8A74_14475 [Polyangium fumosum]
MPQHAPQSIGHVSQLSPPLHVLSPQPTPPPELAVDEAPPPPAPCPAPPVLVPPAPPPPAPPALPAPLLAGPLCTPAEPPSPSSGASPSSVPPMTPVQAPSASKERSARDAVTKAERICMRRFYAGRGARLYREHARLRTLRAVSVCRRRIFPTRERLLRSARGGKPRAWGRDLSHASAAPDPDRAPADQLPARGPARYAHL